MSPTAKNLIVALGIITVVFAGYYFFTQEPSVVVRSAESDRQLQQMLIKTQEFVAHRQILDQISLNTSILEAEEFLALQSFSPEPNEFEVGRDNPFIGTGPEQPIRTTSFTSNPDPVTP